jgi:hypothetical protein
MVCISHYSALIFSPTDSPYGYSIFQRGERRSKVDCAGSSSISLQDKRTQRSMQRNKCVRCYTVVLDWDLDCSVGDWSMQNRSLFSIHHTYAQMDWSSWTQSYSGVKTPCQDGKEWRGMRMIRWAHKEKSLWNCFWSWRGNIQKRLHTNSKIYEILLARSVKRKEQLLYWIFLKI